MAVDSDFKFDWYAATVHADPAELIAWLADAVGGTVDGGTARNGYARGDVVKLDGSTVFTMYSGGRNGHPHVFATSDDAQRLVPLLREGVELDDGRVVPRWPHHVTRMDGCIDLDGPGTWDQVSQLGFDLVEDIRREKGREIKIEHFGDWTYGEGGRTLRVGSPKSAVFLRIYEKGKKSRGEALTDADRDEISPDWCRVEVQVRPEGNARHTAAHCQPVEAFGYADFTKEYLRRLDDIEVERVHIRERRESDHDRAMHYLVKQYGAHLTTEAENVGGWENLGLALFRRIQAVGLEDVEPDAEGYRTQATADDLHRSKGRKPKGDPPLTPF